MSQVRPDIDLAGLARQTPSIPPPRRSPWRIVLPLLILCVFIGVLATSLKGIFETKKSISIVRPRAMQSTGAQASSSGSARVMLQAAGWIEPDPFPIQVSALAAGVVSEVLVLEAAHVAKGDIVARLVDEDARLAVSAATAALSQARAARKEAEVRALVAQTNLTQALAVTENEAVTRAEVDGRHAEVSQRESAAQKGEAGVRAARDEAALQHELESSGAGEARAVDLAEARVAEAEGGLGQLRAEVAIARAEEQKAAARHARALRDIELRLDDKLAAETSLAALERAQAEVESAQVALDEARLRLARMQVVAPSDGVVLERTAMPGTVFDAASSSVVCTLFDPAHLRVRVDVPQSEVSKLAVGGQAEIAIDARSGRPYHGEIVRVVEKADIQKVTLQVHVRVADGDEWLRPEMLAQVRFLAQPSSGVGQDTSAATSQGVEVPARVVENGRVWIVDGVSGTARQREVQLGAQSDEWVEVRSGLDISDKVIDRGGVELHTGDRVYVEERP